MFKPNWMKPFFSVIISTYNRAEMLQRALDSLLKQTEESWEAIIIDDGSEDNTSEIVIPYLKNSKIRYYYQENQGVAAAKNWGIQLAEGKFITFLDSDDDYATEHLFTRKKILTENPEINFLHGGVEILGNPYVPDRENPEKRIHLSDCIIGGTFVIKREILLSLNGFKKMPLATDADLFDRAQKKEGIRFFKTSIPSYHYNRTHQNSITKNIEKNFPI